MPVAAMTTIDLPIFPPSDLAPRRRAFIRDALGIDLHPDVLPLSNVPAVLSPFLLRPDLAMTVVG